MRVHYIKAALQIPIFSFHHGGHKRYMTQGGLEARVYVSLSW